MAKGLGFLPGTATDHHHDQRPGEEQDPRHHDSVSAVHHFGFSLPGASSRLRVSVPSKRPNLPCFISARCVPYRHALEPTASGMPGLFSATPQGSTGLAIHNPSGTLATLSLRSGGAGMQVSSSSLQADTSVSGNCRQKYPPADHPGDGRWAHRPLGMTSAVPACRSPCFHLVSP